jgi:hypothetical protein
MPQAIFEKELRVNSRRRRPPQPNLSITYEIWQLPVSPRYPPQIGTAAIYCTVAVAASAGNSCELGPNTSPTT